MKKLTKPLGLLSITLCAVFVALTCYADPVSVPPTMGDGLSAATPYEIASVGNLYWITQNSTEWDKYYKVTAELDLSTSWEWDTGRGFSPIGSDITAFIGSFDGGDFAITGLFVDRTATPTGMFGVADVSATISNINLVDVDITGDNNVGGLAGVMDGVLYNCMVTGTVTGTAASTGGIAGSGSVDISKAKMTGTVSGDTFVGGILGYSNGAILEECHSDASVSATVEQAGGLVGCGSPITITDSYATNAVSAPLRVGGLIGSSSDAIVTNSYSTALVTGTSIAGGLIGELAAGTVTGSFWDTETSGQATSDGGMGKTSVEMSTLATFTDASWDFTDMWAMDDGVAPPVFLWQFVETPDPEPEPEPELVDDITAFESDSSGGCFIGILN